MIEHCFSRTSVITRLRHGPLGPYLDDLATALHQQDMLGTVSGTICGPVISSAGGSPTRGTRPEVDEALVTRYIRGLPPRPEADSPKPRRVCPTCCGSGGSRASYRRLPRCQPRRLSTTGCGDMRSTWRTSCGAAVSTHKNYLPIAKRFLDTCWQAGHMEVEHPATPKRLPPLSVRKRRPNRWGPEGAHRGVRGFLRFLVVCGELRPGLEAAVPTLRQWTHATLPQRLPAAQVEQVLATCTGSTPPHLRNQAILLLLARLGLRAHEVVTLRLEDIDWHQGHLRSSAGKTHHERLLPLSQEVGQALATYLSQGRPASASRRVFLNFRAPFRPFSGASAISQTGPARDGAGGYS